MKHGRYEAVVIGGGPAGAAAAYTLAAAGRQVCLIDKAQFPRDKLCGGGLTFRAKRAFEQTFGQPWRADLFNTSRDVHFYSRGRFIAAFRSGTPIDFMMRAAFDQYLLQLAERAGAELRLGDSVAAIDIERQIVSLRSGEEIAFECLVGADGVNSIVAKTLYGRAFNPARTAFALEAEVPRAMLPLQGDIVEFDFSAARWGYGWVFPKPTTVTIGVGGLHRLNPELRQRFDFYVATKGLRAGDLKVKGQFLPAGDIRREPGRGNILLCGDAAGAVEPISGEGIPFAIWTGAAAGRAVAASLARAGTEALRLYRRDYDAIVAPLFRGKRRRWLIYPRLIQPVFGWALGFSRVRDLVFTERRKRRHLLSAAASPQPPSPAVSP
jgi:geranylgeranyl reductase family protein